MIFQTLTINNNNNNSNYGSRKWKKLKSFLYFTSLDNTFFVFVLGVGSNPSSWATMTIEMLLKGLFVPLFTSKYKWSNCGLWNSWLIYFKAQGCYSNFRSDYPKFNKDCYRGINVAKITHMNDLSQKVARHVSCEYVTKFCRYL